MNDHKQVNAKHPKTLALVPVDARLKKLIVGIWESGVRTYCSCQDNDKSGFGYIKLADSRDSRHFKTARKAAIELVSELGYFVPVWADVSPEDVFLRFLTKDIAKLTRIMTEGV